MIIDYVMDTNMNWLHDGVHWFNMIDIGEFTNHYVRNFRVYTGGLAE